MIKYSIPLGRRNIDDNTMFDKKAQDYVLMSGKKNIFTFFRTAIGLPEVSPASSSYSLTVEKIFKGNMIGLPDIQASIGSEVKTKMFLAV